MKVKAGLSFILLSSGITGLNVNAELESRAPISTADLQQELREQKITGIEVFAISPDINEGSVGDSSALELRAEYKLSIHQFMLKDASIELLDALRKSTINIRPSPGPDEMDFEIRFLRSEESKAKFVINTICFESKGDDALINDREVVLNGPLRDWLVDLCRSFLKPNKMPETRFLKSTKKKRTRTGVPNPISE